MRESWSLRCPLCRHAVRTTLVSNLIVTCLSILYRRFLVEYRGARFCDLRWLNRENLLEGGKMLQQVAERS